MSSNGADSAHGTPLEGRAFVVKANIDVESVTTTASAYPLWTPSASAVVVDRLRASGARAVGIANMHEWACGATSTVSLFGGVRHPADPSRIAGGSSGGSAVAVAVGAADIGLGTDTGGSVRIPAALTGVYGFKPSREHMSRQGVLPVSESMDAIGYLAADLEVLERVCDAVGLRDSAAPMPELLVDSSWRDEPWIDPAVRSALDGLVARLGDARSVRADFMWDAAPLEAHRRIVLDELVEAHRALAFPREAYGAQMTALFAAGRRVTPAQRAEAWKIQHRLQADVLELLGHDRVIVTPAVGVLAPRQPGPARPGDVRALDRFMTFANLADLPALVIPLPRGRMLPVGIQIVGAPGADSAVLAAAAMIVRDRLTENGRTRPSGSRVPGTAARGVQCSQ